jgi:hypothetical protein
LGNLLQILSMVVIGAGAYFMLQASSDQHRKMLDDHEVRIRAVESSTTRQDEKLETVARDVSDIKIEQRATNALLRQLITNTTGQFPNQP